MTTDDSTMNIMILMSNLTEIYGVGDKLAKRLIEGGFYSVEQVANAEPWDIYRECIWIGHGTAHRIVHNARMLLNMGPDQRFRNPNKILK